jgi:hypothetical protein
MAHTRQQNAAKCLMRGAAELEQAARECDESENGETANSIRKLAANVRKHRDEMTAAAGGPGGPPTPKRTKPAPTAAQTPTVPE